MLQRRKYMNSLYSEAGLRIRRLREINGYTSEE